MSKLDRERQGILTRLKIVMILNGVLFCLTLLLNLKSSKSQKLVIENYNSENVNYIDTPNVFPFTNSNLKEFIIGHDLYDDMIDTFFKDKDE